MVLVNEEIAKESELKKTSDFDFKLTGSGSKFTLSISKHLYNGFMSNSIPISYLRLYFEGTGSVNIEKLFVYKFNNKKFEKMNNIDNSTISLPISTNITDAGFIDVPIGTMDETIDLSFTANGFNRMYAAVNGTITGINKEDLENYLKKHP